jgi:hypothetical protein
MFASKEGAWSSELEDSFSYFFPVKLATPIFSFFYAEVRVSIFA